MIFVVYMIFRISVGYAKKVLRISQFGLIRMVFLHLVMDGIQKYERIHRLQRPVLPRRDLWHDLLADMDKTTN